MELINVKRYYPEEMPFGNNVQYFQSEDGKDFMNPFPYLPGNTNFAFTRILVLSILFRKMFQPFIRQVFPSLKLMSCQKA